jgi:SnoaL-like domain
MFMPTEKELTRFMDRLAIREQIDLYIDRLNHRDWARYGELLTEDFIWSCTEPRKMRIETKKAMVEMVSTVQQYQFGFVFQMGHGIVIDEITNNAAKSRHTLEIVSDSFRMIGIYYDLLVKEGDGVWRFKRRDYQITYCDETPVGGKTFRLLPDPLYPKYPTP